MWRPKKPSVVEARDAGGHGRESQPSWLFESNKRKLDDYISDSDKSSSSSEDDLSTQDLTIHQGGEQFLESYFSPMSSAITPSSSSPAVSTSEALLHQNLKRRKKNQVQIVEETLEEQNILLELVTRAQPSDEWKIPQYFMRGKDRIYCISEFENMNSVLLGMKVKNSNRFDIGVIIKIGDIKFPHTVSAGEEYILSAAGDNLQMKLSLLQFVEYGPMDSQDFGAIDVSIVKCEKCADPVDKVYQNFLPSQPTPKIAALCEKVSKKCSTTVILEKAVTKISLTAVQVGESLHEFKIICHKPSSYKTEKIKNTVVEVD